MRTRNGGAEIVEPDENLVVLCGGHRGLPDGRGLHAGPEGSAAGAPPISKASTALTASIAGVPVVIGGGGVERIMKIELTAAEKKAFESRSRTCANWSRRWTRYSAG